MKNQFKDYILDFVNDSKEELEQKLAARDDAFSLFQDLYNTGYGTINIDDNLIDIHTGGWSDNESLIFEFRQTWWWKTYKVLEIRGGHYYFDTNKNFDNKKKWEIIKK